MSTDNDSARHAGQAWTSGRLVRVGTLALMALVFAVPIVTFMLLSFRQEADNGRVVESVYSLSGLSLDNVIRNWETVLAFNSGIFTTWFGNSIVIATTATLLAVVSAVPAGYAIAKLRFPGRSVLRFVTLLTMVMPNTVLVIPIFLEFSAIGKVLPMFSIGELWSVIVIMAFYPFGVYLSYIHFLTTLPRELIEAARIDGLVGRLDLRQDRRAAGQAGRGAGGVLQLRGQLDQLLPAAGDAAAVGPAPAVGRPAAAHRREPHLRPLDLHRPGREDVAATAGPGYHAHHHPAVHPLHRRPALPHARCRRRRGQGLGRLAQEAG